MLKSLGFIITLMCCGMVHANHSIIVVVEHQEDMLLEKTKQDINNQRVRNLKLEDLCYQQQVLNLQSKFKVQVDYSSRILNINYNAEEEIKNCELELSINEQAIEQAIQEHPDESDQANAEIKNFNLAKLREEYAINTEQILKNKLDEIEKVNKQYPGEYKKYQQLQKAIEVAKKISQAKKDRINKNANTEIKQAEANTAKAKKKGKKIELIKGGCLSMFCIQ